MPYFAKARMRANCERGISRGIAGSGLSLAKMAGASPGYGALRSVPESNSLPAARQRILAPAGRPARKGDCRAPGKS
jgi:hypothetical protein